MKKYIFGTLFSAAVILSSCSTKYLEDMQDYNGFSNEQVYSTESEASGLVDYIYNTIEPTTSAVPLQTLGDGTSYSSTFANSADEFGGSTVYVNNNTPILNSTVSTYFGTNMSNSNTNNTWTRIRQMNLFLDNLDKYGSSTISKASRDKFKGQMYFWRAWQYFDLVRLYGGVPLILHAQVVSSEDPSLQVPRSSTNQCINQICTDLDSAIALLPATWGSNDYGRIDKSAAAAFKARVLYTAACPVFNKDWDNPSSTKWDSAEKAHEVALTYLTANGKALEGESSPGTRASAWAGIFKHFSGSTRTVSPEAIITYLYSSAISAGTSAYRANTWEYSIRPNWQGGSGSLKPCAQIVDKFPMADGSLPVKGVNYDTLSFFVNRDPRFYRTFAFNGSFWPYADSTSSATVWAYNWKSSATGTTYYYSQAGTTVNAGVFIRKMSQDSKIAKINYSYTTTDFIEFRYAEFLLNWSLCYAAQNNLQKALDILVRIRTRAGIPAGANNYGLGFVGSYTKYSLLKAILYERSIELAFEGKRFWDMRNWELFGNPLPALAPSTNVCQALGITPQNGHRRTGFYLLSNTIGKAGNQDANDPLIKLRPNFNGAAINAAVGRLDPDATDAVWNTGISTLQKFYAANYTRTMKDDLDGTGTTSFNFNFAPNYYFFGINTNILSANTYLNSQQTMGWNDLYGTAGTFDPTTK